MRSGMLIYRSISSVTRKCVDTYGADSRLRILLAFQVGRSFPPSYSNC